MWPVSALPPVAGQFLCKSSQFHLEMVQILTNGPGTTLPMCFAAALFRVCGCVVPIGVLALHSGRLASDRAFGI